ncbi:serine hydrolase [Acidimicrobiaceae bacterium USS-CC1]|uniref:Serine hydrolase n=1 Tax=Acidiferrimicrobium australe TaxID=2664430 RepID=A0ABW9QS75_9ACTN|nr:serine hydrolase [Acidiferrimicrobium australe]
MSNELQEKLDELGRELDVPGVAAGVSVGGREIYAFHGVTSVDNPLPVDEATLFQFGSTGKTFTATAVLRLVDEGRVDLDAPVRTYVPELRLKDAEVAEAVTVLQLFNHTAGWDGDLFEDTGNGDDALARYVERMATIEQVTPLGATVSYNNASLSLAGRLIEKVTDKPYEVAMRELVLGPLGLDDTLFFANDVITRRFAVGHTRHDDGRITVNRPWALPRSAHPAGGMSAPAADQIAWARFHLGDGTASDGTRVLSEELLRRMQEPTADMRGSALGDYVGISWLLRDLDGERVVAHGGTTNGQHSDFLLVPARDFAVISMANCGPNGSELNHRLTTWALEHFLGLEEKDPEPRPVDGATLAAYTGRYETIAAVCTITAEGERLIARMAPKEQMAAVLGDADDDPPIPLMLVTGEGDPFVVPDGPAKGMRGYFTRRGDGAVAGVHLGGRLAERVPPAAGA